MVAKIWLVECEILVNLSSKLVATKMLTAKTLDLFGSLQNLAAKNLDP